MSIDSMPPSASDHEADIRASNSQALLDAIIHSLPFRIWACDEVGRCVLQNPVSERDFGPFVGRLTSELPLPPESLSRWQENFQRAMAGEIISAEAEIPVAGCPHVYRYLMAPIRDAERIRGAVGVDIDITDVRRTEQALAASEQRLRSVMENAPDIILQVSRDARISYINRIHSNFEPSQVIGSQAEDWVPPDYRGVVRGAIDRVFATGEPAGYETAGLGPDGTLAWYSTRISPVLLDGRVESAILICTDMTERQRSEAALRDSEERFRQLANSIDEGFWLIDVNPERPLFINPAFERIWGVPATELYDRTRGGERWIHPEHRATVHERFNDWLAGLCDSFDMEYRIVRPDGHTRWVHDRGAKIYDARGKLYRASGIVRDITAQKQAQQDLRDSEARYRLLADHSTDLISRHGRDGKWLYLSPAARTILGYRPEELVGLDPFEFIHSDDRGRCIHAFETLVATGRSEPESYRMRRADGAIIWLESHGNAVIDRGTGRVAEVVVTSRDITDRVEASRQLRQREADLAHAERLSTMGQMASEMAHELNQPLYAIANFAEACLERLRKSPAEEAAADLQRWLDLIAQQARRGGEVLRRVTQFVRKGELDRTVLDLNQCIRDASVLLEFGSRRRGISVAYKLAELLPRVDVDRVLIEQVLLNLVRNAAEAMEHTPAERRRVVIETRLAEEGMVELAVVDSGHGIPEGLAERLFEPYFTTKPDGTGMGLAICR
ncbi:MAG: PAS domain S-box protein [Pirellulaceae bacterium]|nr:PAS domain S-box protein [Pirellulaceae bacterium]